MDNQIIVKLLGGTLLVRVKTNALPDVTVVQEPSHVIQTREPAPVKTIRRCVYTIYIYKMLGKRILILYINKHDFIRVWKNVKGFVRASSFWLKNFF